MRRYSYTIVAIILFALALIIDKTASNSTNPSRYIAKLENYIQKQELKVNSLFEDEFLLRKLINKDFEEEDWEMLQKLNDEGFSFYIYENDSLIFWSNNQVLPFDTDVKYSSQQIIKIVNQKNNRYELIKQPFSFDEDSYRNFMLVGLIPIYKSYPVENEYLKSKFVLNSHIPKAVHISDKPTDYPIIGTNGNSLFFLDTSKPFTDYHIQILLLCLYLLGCIFVLLALNRLANTFSTKYSSLLGLASFIGIVILLRIFSLINNTFGKFEDIVLFQSEHYIPSIIGWSIGDLLVNALLVLWCAIFIYKELKLATIANWSLRNKAIFVGVFYSSVFAAIIGISQLTKGLILSSNASFDFNNVFNLGGNSFVGVVAIVLLLIALFAYSLRMSELVRDSKVSNKLELQVLGGVFILFTLLNIGSILTTITIFLLLYAVLFVRLFDFYVTSDSSANFTWLVLWLFVFSALSSGLLFIHNNEKEVLESMEYAQKLASERDLEAERRFDEIASGIEEDNFIKLIDNPFVPRRGIVEQIDQFYLSDTYLFNKYNHTVHLYSPEGENRKGEQVDFVYFKNIFEKADTTLADNLVFWSNDRGTHFYLADLPILDNGRKLGRVIIQLLPKRLDKSKVYPELLMDEALSEQKKFSKFDYGIYREGKKLVEEGFDYANELIFEMPPVNSFDILRQNKRKYILYQAPNGKSVIIGKDRDELLKPMSLFSYMFCFLAIIIFILALLNIPLKIIPNASALNFKFAASLRNRIQSSVIAVIVLTFITIGLVTVIYFQFDSDEYHTSRLGRKARAIAAQAQYEIENNSWDTTFLPDVISLSQIHRMDINLYNLEGVLQESSQPEIFDKGLVSRRISPLPYHVINQNGSSREVIMEGIGDLNYRSAYLPLLNVNDRVVAYLGLPYYSERSDLRNSVTEFLGALLNVYVFLLLIAGIAAILMSNSITRPLSVLGERLKQVSLDKKNRALEWDTRDEIGTLIEEYNKMIKELDRSATLLAKSEREGAWREMAKQVAHEIKNPLTPMKLSIQYLLRAYQSRPEAIEPLLKRVASTLIEQIDSLSRIATEFSNFAKMPTAVNERFVLNDLVRSVHTLSREGEEEGSDVAVELTMTDKECKVFADKEQLGRVFNNVIKNAIQAIPEDKQGIVKVDMLTENGTAVVKVSDNGVGIPDDKRQAIFVPNFTTKNSGTGLGLAISKNIIENAGGRIYFDSEEGKGTTFFIEMPIVKEDAPVKIVNV